MEDHVTPWNSATNGLSSIMGPIRRYPVEHMIFKVRLPLFTTAVWFLAVRRTLTRCLTIEIHEKLGGRFVSEIVAGSDQQQVDENRMEKSTDVGV